MPILIHKNFINNMQEFKTGGYCPSCKKSRSNCTCLQQQLKNIPKTITPYCECGNELTEKELFYDTCLNCGKTPKIKS